MKIRFIFLSLLLLVLVSSQTSVLAVGKPADVGSSSGRPVATRRPVQNRLTEGKLRACQAKEKAIQQRINHLGKLVTGMESKFDNIAKRTEDFYTTKVVSSRKTVANYDALVTDIQRKKTEVQTALTKARETVNGFNCNGVDPKSQLSQFRTDMQSVIRALKDYRTAIKNLIVAVHSVIGTAEGENK